MVLPDWHAGLGFAHIHWTIWLPPMRLLVWIRQAGFDLNIAFQDQTNGTKTMRKQARMLANIFDNHQSKHLLFVLHI